MYAEYLAPRTDVPEGTWYQVPGVFAFVPVYSYWYAMQVVCIVDGRRGVISCRKVYEYSI